MQFSVNPEVFEHLETACIGVVVARGLDNTMANPVIDRLRMDSIRRFIERLRCGTARQAPEIAPYREAFHRLGFDPDHFSPSIETLACRVEKGRGVPSINPATDLGNAISLRHFVPLSAYDLGSSDAEADVCIRLATPADRFLPFGQEDLEDVTQGEVIYTLGDCVKTRRWLWRQSPIGKVTENSRNVFFPIDGFSDHNLDRILAARDHLARMLQEQLACEVVVGLVDQDHPLFEA